MNAVEKAWNSQEPFLKWLREIRGVSKRTIFSYGIYYKHFKRMETHDRQSVHAFVQKYKNDSIVRGMIGAFLEFAQDKGFDVSDIDLPIKPTGRIKKRIIRTFTPQQIKVLRRSAYMQNNRFGILFDILYFGALRRTETLSIKVNDFDWSSFVNDLLNNNTEEYYKLLIFGKNKKQRSVLIPFHVLKLIFENFVQNDFITFKMSKDDILNFLNSNDHLLFNNLSDSKVWRAIRKIAKNCDLGLIVRPHELRHTRATQLQKAGANIKDIQNYLGHSKIGTTEIYLHTTQEESLENINKILKETQNI